MNLQSRSHRWLKVADTARATVNAMRQQEQTYRMAGRPLVVRKNLPGSGDAALVDRFLKYVGDNKLDKGAVIDKMLSGWLDAAVSK